MQWLSGVRVRVERRKHFALRRNAVNKVKSSKECIQQCVNVWNVDVTRLGRNIGLWWVMTNALTDYVTLRTNFISPIWDRCTYTTVTAEKQPGKWCFDVSIYSRRRLLFWSECKPECILKHCASMGNGNDNSDGKLVWWYYVYFTMFTECLNLNSEVVSSSRLSPVTIVFHL